MRNPKRLVPFLLGLAVELARTLESELPRIASNVHDLALVYALCDRRAEALAANGIRTLEQLAEAFPQVRVDADRIFFSGGYNAGSMMLKVSWFQISLAGTLVA